MIKIICCGIIFQQQLQALLETLSATEPHYIRCVKPNNLLKPAIFENHSVLQQLCCGVRIGLFTFFYCHWQLIHDKKKHSFFFFFEAGCHGGSKDKLFWISYKANLCWIYTTIWPFSSSGQGWKVIVTTIKLKDWYNY